MMGISSAGTTAGLTSEVIERADDPAGMPDADVRSVRFHEIVAAKDQGRPARRIVAG